MAWIPQGPESGAPFEQTLLGLVRGKTKWVCRKLRDGDGIGIIKWCHQLHHSVFTLQGRPIVALIPTEQVEDVEGACSWWKLQHARDLDRTIFGYYDLVWAKQPG